MKKLNRKGFTLIELLAVIVIMAIILVVTVPTIINSISDARVNSIWNLAVSTANSYNTMAANDLLATNKVLEDKEASEDWTCISTDQAELFDLSATDVNLTGTTGISTSVPTVTNNGELDSDSIVGTTCSAIRLKSNGNAEVLLVAANGGKFYISNKTTYGLSSLDAGISK